MGGELMDAFDAFMNVDESNFSGIATSFRVLRLGVHWRMLLERELRPAGVTVASFRVLAYLMMMPAGSTQKDVADAMKTDNSALVRVCELLEKSGFIERKPDVNDRRASGLFLTRLGKRKCQEFYDIAAKLECELTQGISPGDARQARKTLDRILINSRKKTCEKS